MTNSCTKTDLIADLLDLDLKAMRLIPVIDLLAGHVVHARRGQRRHYQPITSQLHPGSDPEEWGRVFQERLGHSDLYVADLDAIAGTGDHRRVVSRLVASGGRVHLDPGIRVAGDLESWLALGVTRVILGTESLAGPVTVREAVMRAGPEHLAIGLDLRAGCPILAPGAGAEWGAAAASPIELLELAVGCGIGSAVVVELASVGSSGGLACWAIPLASECRRRFPALDLWIGGGLADERELADLAAAGISGVLVATALHERKLSQETIDHWTPLES